MSEKLDVNPTPIQRNQYDVAVDLTKLYYSLRLETPEIEEIQETYAKFYAVACGMAVKSGGHRPADKVEELLPEILKR